MVDFTGAWDFLIRVQIKRGSVCIGLALEIRKPTLGSFITFQELFKYDWHWYHAFLNCTSWFKNSLHTYCLFKEWIQKKPGHMLQTIFLPNENFIRYFNINVMDVTLYNHSMHVLFLLSFWSLWWRMRLLLLLFGAPAGWGNITPGILKCMQLLSCKSYFSFTKVHSF